MPGVAADALHHAVRSGDNPSKMRKAIMSRAWKDQMREPKLLNTPQPLDKLAIKQCHLPGHQFDCAPYWIIQVLDAIRVSGLLADP